MERGTATGAAAQRVLRVWHMHAEDARKTCPGRLYSPCCTPETKSGIGLFLNSSSPGLLSSSALCAHPYPPSHFASTQYTVHNQCHPSLDFS